MKLRILSDIHNEFGRWTPPKVEADVVVLAGDIGDGLQNSWLDDHFLQYKQSCVQVLGNHELYKRFVNAAKEQFFEDALRGGDLLNGMVMIGEIEENAVVIHALENSSTIIDGIRFLGCTLWTDFDLFGDPVLATREAARKMNDFKIIYNDDDTPITPHQTILWHKASVAWLKEQIKDKSLPTVIVTHHAPSIRSINPKHLDDPMTAAFASNLDALVEESGALLWIHGHTHHCCDYKIGKTRVISNQAGYRHEDTGFDPTLVVEI